VDDLLDCIIAGNPNNHFTKIVADKANKNLIVYDDRSNKPNPVSPSGSNTVENTQAAESAIRDTDMAEEMVRFSNYNILSQAGQSILAQANQTPQGIISLLQ